MAADAPRPPSDRPVSTSGFDAIRHLDAPAAPAPPEVHGLVEQARRHPLGLDFLLRGAANAVAATFGVHAFLVDAARDYLSRTATPQA